MIDKLIHLFLPHHTNNHRPRILHPAGLSLLIGIYLFSQASLKLVALYDSPLIHGNVLGYASNISTSDVINLINQERVQLGKRSLTENPTLSSAAAAKAQDMFQFDYWAHNNPQTGRQPWDFIKQAGYVYRYAGENLARDFGDTPSMVAAWMASPTHRDNIVSDRYLETGVAVVNGQLQGVETTLVVQMFGTQASAQAVSGVTLPVASAPPQRTPQPVVTVPVVQAAEPNTTATPIPPLAISKSIALSIILLMVVTLILDYLIITRRRIIRLTGKNLAHLAFLAAVTIIVIASKSGGIL